MNAAGFGASHGLNDRPGGDVLAHGHARRIIRAVAVLLASLVAGATGIVVFASNASAATLSGGVTLSVGRQVYSPKGAYRLIMQTDGNLVEYAGNTALWASGTSGSNNHASMQTDGNLVVYSSGNTALWQSATYGHSGSVLALQDDSNLVIYQGSTAIWAKTSSRTSSTASNTLVSGQWINSGDGRFKLVMQTDGNLVEYGPSGAVWSTATNGTTNHAVMQTDGNFVVYTSGNKAIWQSGTGGTPGSATLNVQNDGNVVIYETYGAIWNRFADPDASAVTWAMAHNGQVYGSAAEQPADQHQWSGYCWTFVYNAFRGKAPKEPTAQDAYNYYSARGMIHGGTPPTGSIAFWSYGSDGHAAVAIGGGQTIGTHGTSTNRYAVYQVGYQSRGLPYLGWAMP